MFQSLIDIPVSKQRTRYDQKKEFDPALPSCFPFEQVLFGLAALLAGLSGMLIHLVMSRKDVSNAIYATLNGYGLAILQ